MSCVYGRRRSDKIYMSFAVRKIEITKIKQERKKQRNRRTSRTSKRERERERERETERERERERYRERAALAGQPPR